MKFKTIFANICQGLIFAGERDDVDLFFGYIPSRYLEFFKQEKPDVLCLAEAPLEDKECNSVFIDKVKAELGLQYCKIQLNDKSWLVEDKYYGTAILSKFPITNYESFILPNPKFEVDHQDGTHWIMNDKGAQKASLEIEGKKVNVFNLHYFPVHHFKHRLDDPVMIPYKKALSDILKPKQDEMTIVTGDFNNKWIEIEQAFPEIFKEGLKKAIEYDRREVEKYYVGDGIQVDHILYSNGLTILDSKVICNFSDHSSLIVEFEI